MKPAPSRGVEANGQHLVLYDGVCGLCNGFVRFVLAQDHREVFDFASLQSQTGRSFLQRFGRAPDALDTLGLVANYRTSPALLVKSAAALTVTKSLAAPWRWLGIFGVVPTAIRDWVYDRVASSRYRLFGRYDTCPIPSAQQRHRFVDF